MRARVSWFAVAREVVRHECTRAHSRNDVVCDRVGELLCRCGRVRKRVRARTPRVVAISRRRIIRVCASTGLLHGVVGAGYAPNRGCTRGFKVRVTTAHVLTLARTYAHELVHELA